MATYIFLNKNKIIDFSITYNLGISYISLLIIQMYISFFLSFRIIIFLILLYSSKYF